MKSKILAFVLVILCWHSHTGHAQPDAVQITILIPPPYSPYLLDYIQYENKMVIQLQNLTSQSLSLKLTGSVEGDNGIALTTNENYLPAMPISLPPQGFYRIPASSRSRDFFDPANLVFTGPENLKVQVLKDGILPEGNYMICLKALDYIDNTPLSGESPAGCTFLPITYPTPPQLIAPLCDETIETLLPFFQLTLPGGHTGSAALVYDLYIIEWLTGTNPHDLVQLAVDYNAGNAIIRSNLRTPSYQYSITDPKLKKGVTYLWAVKVKDPMGKTTFENNGLSEICSFHVYDDVSTFIAAGPVMPPVKEISPESFSVTFTQVSGKLHHRFKHEQFANGQVEYMAAEQGSEEIHQFGLVNLQSLLQTSTPGGSGVHITGGISGSGGTGGSGGTSSGGGIGPANNTGLIDFTNHTPWGGLTFQQPTYIFADNLFEENLYIAGSRPLPHTNVSLVEQYIMVGHGDLINLNSLTPLEQNAVLTSPYSGYFSGDLPLNLGPRIIQTVKTNSAGHYQFNAHIHRPAGIVAGKVDIPPGPGLPYGGSMYPSVFSGNSSISGKFILRVYRIIVEDPRYYSPDVMLMLQPGIHQEVETQTALIRSYHMQVHVGADGGMLAQGAVPTVEGMLIRRWGDLQAIKASHPAFEPADYPEDPDHVMTLADYGIPHGVTGNLMSQAHKKGVAYYRINMSVDDGGNGILNIRNMVAHIDNSASMYYLILQTPHHSVYNYGPLAIPVYTGSLTWHNNWLATDSPVLVGSDFSAYKGKAFNHQHIEPQVNVEATLHPNHPEIYFQVKEQNIVTGQNNQDQAALANLPNVRVDISSSLPNHIEGFTDQNGKYRKKLQMPAGASTLPLIILLSKSGYAGEVIPANGLPHHMQMGERYPAKEIIMHPKGKVTLEVRDELAEPAKSYVQFGDGLIALTTKVCQQNTSPGVTGVGDGPLHTPLDWLEENIIEVPGIDPVHNPADIVSNPWDILQNPLHNLGSLNQLYGRTLPPVSQPLGGLDISELNTVPYSGQGATTGGVAAGGYGSGILGSLNYECRETVTMRAPSGNAVPLRIEPLATKYEELNTTVHIPESQGSYDVKDLGTFTVLYKRRKAMVHVKCGPPVWIPEIVFPTGLTGNGVWKDRSCEIPASIKLHKTTQYLSELPGSVYFAFMSPGNTFRLVVNAGDDFVKVDTFVELGYTVKEIEIVLQEAVSISGRVTDAATGEPIKGARIYTSNGQNTIETIYTETHSDSEGYYVLKGIKPYFPDDPGQPDWRDIYAVKTDGSVTYIGQKKNININGGGTAVNFALQPLTGWDISHLLGYRVEITAAHFEISPPSGGQGDGIGQHTDNAGELVISGMVTQLPSNGNFKAEQPGNVRLLFKDVPVKKHHTANSDGRYTAVPINESVVLDDHIIRITVNHDFLATVYGTSSRPAGQQSGQAGVMEDPYLSQNGGYTPSGYAYNYGAYYSDLGGTKLRIFKETYRTGSLWGLTDIKLESFEFPNDFDARFYLGHTPNDCRVKVFESKPPSLYGIQSPGLQGLVSENQLPPVGNQAGGGQEYTGPRDTFYIGTKGSGHALIHPTYRVEGFPAFARTDESRLIDDVFSLRTRVSIAVPEMEPSSITIPVGNVLIRPNSIVISYFGNGISFNLGTWQVKSPQWHFDQNTSSIRLNNTEVHTKYIKFNVGTLYLQPNKPPITVTNLDYDITENLMLANVTDLHLHPNANVQLYYDQPLHIHESSDKKIYRLTIAKAGGNACYIELPGHVDGNTINFKYFHIYSDGKDYLHVANHEEISFYGGFRLGEVKIEGGVNYFDIIGTPKLDFPDNGRPDNMITSFRFRKPGQQIVRDIISNSFQISSLRGHMSFTGHPADNTTRVLSNGLYQVYGTLKVKTNNQERFSLYGRLTYGNGGQLIKIETFDISDPQAAHPMPGNIKQKIYLAAGGNTNYFDVLEGSLPVSGSGQSKSWNALTFHTELKGADADKGLKAGQRRLWFTAQNNTIDANNGQWLGTNNMTFQNAGGNIQDQLTFNSTFDYNKNALRGDWSIPLSDIPGVVIALGSNVTVSGDIHGGFKFSPAGFYFYLVANDVRVQPIPVDLSVFTIIGSTTYGNIDKDVKDLFFPGAGGQKVWKRMSRFPDDIVENGLAGIFVGGNASVVDFSFELDLVLLGIALDIEVGADVYSYFNFGPDNAGFGFGALAYAAITLEAWILVCDLCLSAEAQVGFCGQLSVNSGAIAGMARLTFSAGFCGVSFSETVKMVVELSSPGGFSVDFGGNNRDPSCLKANNKNQKKCGSGS